ncbi:MAG: hypothetical protein ACO3UU_10685 [Minisyncoccia bacterium]
MTVKLAIFKSGENIISDIKEGFYGEKLACYILENPCKVSINGSYKVIGDDQDSGNMVSISLHQWPSLSKDTIIEIVPECIVTLVEPNSQLKEMYETQVLKNRNETDSVDKQSNSNQSD